MSWACISQGYGFSSGHVWMWELECEESWVPKNWCFWTVVLEKTLESLWDCKEIQPVHPKGDQSSILTGRTDIDLKLQYFGHLFWEQLTHWKRPWCWERVRAGEEGGKRGWNERMVSLTQSSWVSASSRSWWWTEKPGMLQSMGSQRVRHDWATELNWTEHRMTVLKHISYIKVKHLCII